MQRELGAFERALLISDHYAPFNVMSVLQLENAPAPDILQQALGFVQARHPLLRARIIEKNKHSYFEVVPDLSTPIAFVERTHPDQIGRASCRERVYSSV